MKKRVADLVIGDVIVEKVLDKKKKERTYFYKVTDIQWAACIPEKTHVTVDGTRHWCYDTDLEITVR